MLHEPDASSHEVELKSPSDEEVNQTVPVGVEDAPESVSEIVTVHVVVSPTGRVDGSQVRLEDVVRTVAVTSSSSNDPEWSVSPAYVPVTRCDPAADGV